MRRDDVVHHSDGYREGHPAINIKLYGLWEDVLRAAPKVAHEDGEGDDKRFVAWLNGLEDQSDLIDDAQGFAAESEWEMLQQDADEIFDRYSVKLYQEGRMGGWLVVHGLPDVEEWDAVMLGKWAKLNRYVREYLENFPRVMAEILYLNPYTHWREADDKRIAVESTRGDLDALTGDPHAEQESNYRMIV